MILWGGYVAKPCTTKPHTACKDASHLLASSTEPSSSLRQEICLRWLLFVWTELARPASTLQQGVVLHPGCGALLDLSRVELAAPTCLFPCAKGSTE